MRVDTQTGGFSAVQEFIRSGQAEQVVTIEPPSEPDRQAYGCPSGPTHVRLVRHVASTGAVRVLMTSLMDPEEFPAAGFGDLYHQRWRGEETFKRLKHRLNIEHVTGLSQLAVMQDVAAKVLCDNLKTLIALEARQQHGLPAAQRINHAAAFSILKPLIPRLLLGRSVQAIISGALEMIAGRTYTHQEDRSNRRQARPKSHKYTANQF